MENELITVAKRDNGNVSMFGSLSTFLLFTVFLVIDIIFYKRDGSTWQLVLLIISAVLDFFAVLALLFAWSVYKYNKKIEGLPLISFDKNKNAFIVMDCFFHKELEINKDDVIEVKTNEKGDTYMWHNKESKKTSTFIGYSNKSSQDLINNELAKYKNLEC